MVLKSSRLMQERVRGGKSIQMVQMRMRCERQCSGSGGEVDGVRFGDFATRRGYLPATNWTANRCSWQWRFDSRGRLSLVERRLLTSRLSELFFDLFLDLSSDVVGRTSSRNVQWPGTSGLANACGTARLKCWLAFSALKLSWGNWALTSISSWTV